MRICCLVEMSPWSFLICTESWLLILTFQTVSENVFKKCQVRHLSPISLCDPIIQMQ